MMWKKTLTDDELRFTQKDIMLKLLSTIDERGWPHITMISCMGAKRNGEFIWGQFSQGRSKKYVRENSKQGFYIMNSSISIPIKFIHGKINLKRIEDEGENIETFSKIPLLRYNTYLNCWRAYINDIVAVSPFRKISLLGMGKGILAGTIAKGGINDEDSEDKLSNWAYNLINSALSFKFICYLDPSDGYPLIIPCLQLRAANKSTLIFPKSQFKDELNEIPLNSHIAVSVHNFEAISHLINGRLVEYKKSRGITVGIVEIDEIYNPMPPVPGVIYPKRKPRPKVTSFDL
ncbi:MAG: hypothetical protein GF364_20070 [Candidatus Lokiarchaeota archaeon]|nr:hypothetical protein [Candidatus Lokiarchaeota archaeon]